eukprot:4396904-Amphidinium_carterae.2
MPEPMEAEIDNTATIAQQADASMSQSATSLQYLQRQCTMLNNWSGRHRHQDNAVFDKFYTAVSTFLRGQTIRRSWH